jgi:RNA-directed DNA polymerase
MIIERMARDLGLPKRFIENLARGASHEYKVYYVKKRNGGFREIHHPSKRLKALQRWFLSNVLDRLPVHAAAAAYREGRSIFDNAKIHAPHAYLLRMDLTNFFPSIKEQDLRKYISEQSAFFSGWNVADVEAFCLIVCRYGAVTIGAPTSPALSNAICYELDVRLHSLCERRAVKYSRYADDLFFSCDQPHILRRLEGDVTDLVTKLEVPANLKVNASKTRHSSRRQTRRVTGITLSSDGKASIGRSLKRRIRGLIYKFESLDRPSQASLAGMIAYAVGFDPQFKNNLIDKYGLTRVRQVTRMTPLDKA